MINNSNEYSIWSYELGFQHAKENVERPIKGQCDHFYWLGYQSATI